MDETYVKMCKEAGEIQELWKPKEGDPFECTIRDKVSLKIHDGIYNYTHQIWLPRQEDLQEIYKSIKDVYIDCEIFEEFMHWMFNFTCRNVDYPNGELPPLFGYSYRPGVGNEAEALPKSISTLNELWLEFVMETVFNKAWNCLTESWEVIT